ncbi:MAG TPA: hypothetical protein VJK02_10095 [Anaerolineales bacterium]|nr:hypothetical protein [Anaerolineales bacterium]
MATIVATLLVVIAEAVFPSADTTNTLGGGLLLLFLAVPMGLAGLVAGDRLALRRWPDLREIRKAQASARRS